MGQSGASGGRLTAHAPFVSHPEDIFMIRSFGARRAAGFVACAGANCANPRTMIEAAIHERDISMVKLL